ncbi:MAG TPA: hypothetical protein VM243_04760 [Phycisphaerae bacterium]|nr:hypothetical protein [Phycisphaerae bacterium]
MSTVDLCDSGTGGADPCPPRPFMSAPQPLDHFFGGVVVGLVVPGLGPGVEDGGGVFGGWLGLGGFCGPLLLGLVLI